MILVINTGLSNIKSITNILEYIGEDPVVSNKPEDILKADRIILPGVGTYHEGMRKINSLNILPALNEAILEKKTPFLGICLGMHLLSSVGYEMGESKGIDFIKGKVDLLKIKDLKVPHMGWNDLEYNKSHPLFEGIEKDKNFYFVHSYEFIAENEDDVFATCSYGKKIVSAIGKNNIFGTQFHPEKSQQNGLRFMENFIAWDPKC